MSQTCWHRHAPKGSVSEPHEAIKDLITTQFLPFLILGQRPVLCPQTLPSSSLISETVRLHRDSPTQETDLVRDRLLQRELVFICLTPRERS